MCYPCPHYLYLYIIYLRVIWDTQSGLFKVTQLVSSRAIGLALTCGWLSFVSALTNHATWVNLVGSYGRLLLWWPPMDNACICVVPLSMILACLCDFLWWMDISKWDASRHVKSPSELGLGLSCSWQHCWHVKAWPSSLEDKTVWSRHEPSQMRLQADPPADCSHVSDHRQDQPLN